LPEAPLRRGQFSFMAGWIKIYRQVKDKAYYKDSEFIHLWIHLLLCANHAEAEFLSGYDVIKLKKGQFVTGRKKLSLETGISESKIERILKVFESEQQIEQQTNSRNRLISIVSWDKYQESEQQMNSERTASEQQVNTNNKNNNNKEELRSKKPPKIKFEDSEIFDKHKFLESFENWSKEKLAHYYDAALRYSIEGNKYVSWKLAIQTWAKKDELNGVIIDKPKQKVIIW
jgi:DNA-binding transcriptional MocR family regulator